MLQNFKRESVVEIEWPKAVAPKTPLYVILGIGRRQFWIILACALLALAAATLYLFVVRPTYTASTTLMIDSRTGGIQQKSVLGDASPTDTAWIDSQIGILSLIRDEIGRSITQQLRLAEDPTIFGPHGALGGDLIAPAARLFGGAGENDTLSGPVRAQQLAGAVAGGLEVKRVGLSYLVNINFSSHSQEQAVKIANAAADAYVAEEMRAKSENLRQASNWLQERYETLRDQAVAAERAVVEFKSKNDIITAGGKLINDQQLTEINDRLGAARAKTADQQARLDQIETVLKDQERSGTFDSTVSDALLNPIVTGLRAKYLDLINKEANWAKRFGPNHKAVANLRSQEQDIRNSTHEELKRIAESYRSDLEIARKNEAELEKQLAAVVSQIPNDAQITLRALESSAQSYRTFYDNFFLHYTESVQQESSPIPDTRVVSYASWAYKSSPNPPRIFFLSLLGGLALGVGVALLREAMDGAFRTSTEVQQALRRECLALIPMIPLVRRSESEIFRHQEFLQIGDQLVEDTEDRRIINSATGALRFLVDAPLSQFTESIRALKFAADLRGDRGAAKVIGLTSSVSREGKSTIATALAGLTAQVGARVILVDCDLRNPALSQSLAPNATAGVLEVISGQRSLESTVWIDLETRMEFLPAVNVSRLSNTDQILFGDCMKELFNVLRRKYDYIIVDLSPLLPVVDVRATAELVDFYIFVIEWGETKTELIHQALEVANEIYEKVLGFALNKVKMNLIGRYEDERARYYRDS